MIIPHAATLKAGNCAELSNFTFSKCEGFDPVYKELSLWAVKGNATPSR
jgi:hypothetical protein